MIRAVVFDFNGVLVDDERVHFELFREILGESGIVLGEAEYYEEYLGYDDRGCFETALRRAGMSTSPDVIAELIARKAGRYEAVAEGGGLTLFPGAAEAVSGLAERWPVAICSGALRGEIEFVLGKLGVRDRVSAIVSAEDTDRCKPDPEGYFLALDALRSLGREDLEAAHCLAVEDSRAGLQSAKAAGMWSVGITHTYPERELRLTGADVVIDRLDGLSPEAIARWFVPEVSP